MNFLGICKRVHLLLRIDEAAPGTAPATVTGQTGKLGEIVQWVQFAYADIQHYRPDWLFLRTQGSLTVAAGTESLTLADIRVQLPTYRYLKPTEHHGRRYVLLHGDDVSDQSPVTYVPYERWRFTASYDRGSLPTARPAYFTVRPDGGVEFNTSTDREYTLSLDYVRTPGTLAADDDEPIFPPEYHMAIVWWAILNYYCMSRDKTGELMQKAQMMLKRELNSMSLTQLPEFGIGGD